MGKKINVCWTVEGGSGEEWSEIDVRDFRSLSGQALADEIESHVHEDFKQRVWPEVEDMDMIMEQIIAANRKE